MVEKVDIALEIVDAVYADLSDRSGFSCLLSVDYDIKAEIRDDLKDIVLKILERRVKE